MISRLLGKKPQIIVRAWNDPEPYKKIFVLQGFYELDQQGQVTLELRPYDYFEERGAPPQVGGPYYSHKNIVLLEVTVADKTIRVAYDANDLYYKIPNSVLRWCNLYFKSHYQEQYLQSGIPLEGLFWEKILVRSDALPEKLDVSQAFKFRRASFSMELYPKFSENHAYLKKTEGLWHKDSLRRKDADVFFLGRYWHDTRDITLALFDSIGRMNLRVAGGIIKESDSLPPAYTQFVHGAVGLRQWCEMSGRSRLSLMTRGLAGCVSFKPLNYLMVGAPFIANEFMSNLWMPLIEGTHYRVVKDDFSDFTQVYATCTDEMLTEMGYANLMHWQKYISPEATARYILDEANKLL